MGVGCPDLVEGGSGLEKAMATIPGSACPSCPHTGGWPVMSPCAGGGLTLAV